MFQQWKEETRYLSDAGAMFRHPAYKKIIAMGEPAVPLILATLKSDPQHVFHALYRIAKENPLPPEHAGRLYEMAADWIEWGRQKGYLS